MPSLRQTLLAIAMIACFAFAAFADEASDRRQAFADFLGKWTSNDISAARSCFAKDAIGKGTISFDEASKLLGESEGRINHENTLRQAPKDAPDSFVVWQYWVNIGPKEKPHSPKLRVTEETYKLESFNSKFYVTNLTVTDVTEKAEKNAHDRIAENEKDFHDESNKAGQLFSGLLILNSYYKIAETQNAWPILKQLLPLGLMNKKSELTAVQNCLRKLVSYEHPPEEYKDVVNQILNAK